VGAAVPAAQCGRDARTHADCTGTGCRAASRVPHGSIDCGCTDYRSRSAAPPSPNHRLYLRDHRCGPADVGPASVAADLLSALCDCRSA